MTAYATAAMHSRLLLNQNVHVLNCIHCQKAFAGAELYNSSSSVIINWKDIKKPTHLLYISHAPTKQFVKVSVILFTLEMCMGSNFQRP